MDRDAIPTLSGAKPFIGHLRELQDHRLRFVSRISDEVDRIAQIRSLGNLRAIAINHPESLHEVLVEKARSFEKSAMTRFALYPLAGEGLFTSKWALWKKQRKLMAPVFHPGTLAAYADAMTACTDRTTATWTHPFTTELLKETTRITMSIAGKTLFDADTFTDADAIGESLTVALEWAAHHSPSRFALAHLIARRAALSASERFPTTTAFETLASKLEGPIALPFSEGRKLKRAVSVLNDRVQQMIDARRAEGELKNDLLAKLVQAQDEDDGSVMSDKQIRDEVLTLFVAGHETTATALAWAVYSLCKNPAIYEATQHEVDSLNREPTFSDLAQLPLTLRVFKEALRLYPPVYIFGRQTIEDTTVQGYALPRHTVIMIAPYALHRRADIWPDPQRFDPNRFLPDVEAARHKLAWIPFGAGPRVCIGAQFAMMEGQLVLAKLLRAAKFTALRDEVPEPSATLRPSHGMPMRIEPRRPAPPLVRLSSSLSPFS